MKNTESITKSQDRPKCAKQKRRESQQNTEVEGIKVTHFETIHITSLILLNQNIKNVYI